MTYAYESVYHVLSHKIKKVAAPRLVNSSCKFILCKQRHGKIQTMLSGARSSAVIVGLCWLSYEI